jgi:hypothetical protein
VGSGYPSRLNPNARLLLAAIVIAVVIGIVAVLALVDARSKPGSGGPERCGPTGIDFPCPPTGNDDRTQRDG